MKKIMEHTSHLDIGCNSTPRNPFNSSKLYGVEIIDLETRNDIWLIKTLKNIFYTIYFIKKSDLIWEFQAIKDDVIHD